jgi:hypothetical protein
MIFVKTEARTQPLLMTPALLVELGSEAVRQPRRTVLIG